MSVAARLAAPMLRANRPLDLQIRRSANLSTCETYRWALRRWWFTHELYDGLILPWIMLNPSHGDGEIDDPTLQRIIGFSWRWGFDGILVVNLFPYRSPKPSALQEWLRWEQRRDWDARDALWANQAHVAGLLRPFDAAMAAWGSPGGSLGWTTTLAADSMLDAINDPDAEPGRSAVLKLFCLGETAAGDPTHPMARGRHRVKDDAVPVPLRRYPGTIVGLGDEVVAA